MKRTTILLSLVFALLGTVTTSARDQWVIGDKAYDVDTLVFPHLVGPGVTAAKFDIPALPLKVSVTEMDLTNPYIVMETCLGGEKSVACETPVNMAIRNTRPGHEVVAAVNGDFFMTSPTNEVGLPLSGQVRNDELVLSGHNRACLALDENNRPYIDRLTFSGRVTSGSHSFALNLVNRMRYAYENIAACCVLPRAISAGSPMVWSIVSSRTSSMPRVQEPSLTVRQSFGSRAPMPTRSIG